MSPCQHGGHRGGRDRSVTAPRVSLCLSGHPNHPQHSSNKVIYSHTLMGWLLSGGTRVGTGGLWGDLGTAGDWCHHLQPCHPSRGRVTVKEGSGGRGEVRTLLARAGILFPRRGDPGGSRLGIGSVPSGTALPARKWAGERRDPAGTARSRPALLR